MLALAVLLLTVDATVLYLAVPSLAEDLGATATEVLWIGDIYSLTIAGLLVVMGTLADRIGRKRLLLVGATAFGAASVMAGLSQSAEMLIVARLLLGIAAATLMPSTLSLIRNIFTDSLERTRAIAVWSAAATAGAAAGPLVGGILLENFWWGSVFLINVPVVLLVVVAGFFLLPESKDPNPGRFDLTSAVLSLAAIVPVVYAVKHTVQSGIDVLGVACVVGGLLLGWLFVRRQRRLPTPLIDVELFRNMAFTGAVLAAFTSIFALAGLFYFFSQYLQLVRGFSPLQAGLAELPATLASIVVIAMVSWVLARLGVGSSISVGLLLAAAGLLGIAVAEGAQSYLWLGLALALVGLGVGLTQTVTTDAVVSAVPPDKAGSASAIAETAYELGIALGIAVLGSLMNALYRLHLKLPNDIPQDQREAAEESLATALHVLEPSSPAASLVRAAFTSGMQTTALVAAAITLVAAALAWRTIPSAPEAKRPVDVNH